MKEEVVLGVAVEEGEVRGEMEVQEKMEGMGRVVGREEEAVAKVVVARVREEAGNEVELQARSPG